jgi:transcription initiation factor TFIIE subunit alpha
MRASKKIQDWVITFLCGEDVLPIVEYLKGKENISEFIIAEDLKLDLNVMRNQLYRLQKHNFLTFKRKKDKKKGWYIYYWTLNLSDIPFLYLRIKNEELSRLKSRLEREKASNFFSCNNSCMRLSFEQSMEFNFSCPECGSIMNQVSNDHIISDLEEKIDKLEQEIQDFDEKYMQPQAKPEKQKQKPEAGKPAPKKKMPKPKAKPKAKPKKAAIAKKKPKSALGAKKTRKKPSKQSKPRKKPAKPRAKKNSLRTPKTKAKLKPKPKKGKKR